jgi:hypothetical protein
MTMSHNPQPVGSDFRNCNIYCISSDCLCPPQPPDSSLLQTHDPSYFFFPMARQPLVGLGRLIFRGFTITQFLDTPHSVELLWTSDQPDAKTST